MRPIAWERGVRFGLLTTLRDLALRPSAFFGGLPDGPIGRPLALAFGLWASFLTASVLIGVPPEALARPWFWLEAMVFLGAMAGAATGCVLVATAPLAHGISSAFGRRSRPTLTIRACLYLQAYASVGLTCLLVATVHMARQRAAGYVPPVHPERDRAFVVAGFAVAVALGAMGARGFALGRHRLSPAQAWVFALLPAAAVAAAARGMAVAAPSWGPTIRELLGALLGP